MTDIHDPRWQLLLAYAGDDGVDDRSRDDRDRYRDRHSEGASEIQTWRRNNNLLSQIPIQWQCDKHAIKYTIKH